jgi:HlyD family secretion protein
MKLFERDLVKNGHAAIAPDATPPKRDWRDWRHFPRWYYYAAGAALVAIVALVFMLVGRAQAPGAYVTVPVVRQTLVQTVTASGAVNPQDTVSVGTQASGTINAIFVDFNSKVRKGQILATLDPAPLQAALNQARANLAQAEAQSQATAATALGSGSNVVAAQDSAAAALAQVQVSRSNQAVLQAAVQSADANVAKAQSALSVAQLTVSRDQGLLAQGYVAQSTADLDRSNLAAAQAALSSAQVAASQARIQAAAASTQIAASIDQSQQQAALGAVAGSQAMGTQASHQASVAAIAIQAAQVDQAQQNLDRATITSPVDGTVIARNVSVGQTVAASFQTPTLFLLARDLSKMQVDVAVGEPDIGAVKPRQIVDFTVLAYPTRTFHGTVMQVRLNPTVVSNVVTYDTVVLAQNPDGALRPGMTANASIHVAKAQDALIVPVEALQWRPSGGGNRTGRRGSSAGAAGGGATAGRASGASGASGNGAGASGAAQGGSAWGQTNGASSRAIVAGANSSLFVLKNGKLQRIPVTILLVSGATAAVATAAMPDGTPAAVQLAAGDEVITGQATASSSAQPAARSPLTGSGGVPRGVGGGRGGGG